ncbi:4-alpha-glucanotransferase (amylomaltase) [Thermosulfurimonas dismutans]|uniref:4-alpha-glucanotransferase n=1 Tax=Thermosulfurimonas dismutans TaxID=999894 RepID=A0A179D1S9_9BACT|nr:4-alpha-glucanotransferase [Thermosulfurimonas dismutans]OAQ19751.1 4-alpha-glucanotransferase (amylomaltase) [Thermosulfurimonas dismutans]
MAYLGGSGRREDGCKWALVEAPAQKFFEAVFRRLLNPSLLAEDLGYITSDVREIRKLFGIPGMKVLVFAFFEEDSPYLPHNHEKEAFVYTGTHDTNTVKGKPL